MTRKAVFVCNVTCKAVFVCNAMFVCDVTCKACLVYKMVARASMLLYGLHSPVDVTHEGKAQTAERGRLHCRGQAECQTQRMGLSSRTEQVIE